MIKVSDAIRDILKTSTFLRFGFQYQLLNLTQLAKFIQPLVEARVKKEITPGAIVMSLSRIGKEFEKKGDKKNQFFKINNIMVHTDLTVATLFKTKENHKAVNTLYKKIQSKSGLMTITEGFTEITIIFESKYAEFSEPLLRGDVKTVQRNVASLGVKFDDQYLETPGFLYAVLRQVALQGINIVELASTGTEFNIFMQEKDVQLAFDTLYQTFSSREKHGIIQG